MLQTKTRATCWKDARTCPACGYAGEELQREGFDAVFFCPGCDQDLYVRPARSYAEREGLSGPQSRAIIGRVVAERVARPIVVGRRHGVRAWLVSKVLGVGRG